MLLLSQQALTKVCALTYTDPAKQTCLCNVRIVQVTWVAKSLMPSILSVWQRLILTIECNVCAAC